MPHRRQKDKNTVGLVKDNMVKFIIELNKGVLPFFIGNPIDCYQNKYPFVFVEGGPDESWDEYDFFDASVEVYINKLSNKIDTICCRNNCYLNEVNLIGLAIEEFFMIYDIGKSDYKVEKIFLTDEEQDVYGIDKLGLQLWVNSFGKIVTVFVSD